MDTVVDASLVVDARVEVACEFEDCAVPATKYTVEVPESVFGYWNKLEGLSPLERNHRGLFLTISGLATRICPGRVRNIVDHHGHAVGIP